MGLFDFLKRKETVNLDENRRELLQKNGRITEGVIIDTETSERGEEIVFYLYTIQGVDFESSDA